MTEPQDVHLVKYSSGYVCEGVYGRDNIWISRVKQIVLPSVGGPDPISWPESNKKAHLLTNNKELLLYDCLPAEVYYFFPPFRLEIKYKLFLDIKPASLWPGTILSFPSSQPFRLRLELYHQHIWVFSLKTAVLGTLASIIGQANSLQKFSLDIWS